MLPRIWPGCFISGRGLWEVHCAKPRGRRRARDLVRAPRGFAGVILIDGGGTDLENCFLPGKGGLIV